MAGMSAPDDIRGAAPSDSDRDTLFASDGPVADFKFDEKTVAVFDDMVARSVPFYHEIQRMLGELAADFAIPGTRVFDLGCSTGTTLLVLDRLLPPEIGFVGVDNSADMLAKARGKFHHVGSARNLELRLQDLNQDRIVEHASVVVMNLTLQFVRPLNRERALRWIFEGLHSNGCLLLVEKQTPSASLVNRLFIDHYYAFKRRNGYSDLEIAQKREALENVLIPYRPEENRALLESIGFGPVEEFFRWYNFAGILAIKR
jgi:tRNA (cmo5U34)-methyltransferase